MNEMEGSKIQRLFDACNATFSKREELPTLQKIQWLQSLLDSIEAVDVGIDEFSDGRSALSCRRTLDSIGGHRGLICARGISQMTYIHIFESDYFSIGIFCFPAGAKLPLHDHPKMTVLSKVLYGSIHVKAYDWVKNWHSGGKMGGLGGLVLDGVLQAPCESSVLFPASGGNIHSYTALTPCAILDILSPPYSEELGRPCTYYRDITIPAFPGYAILEKRELPDDLVVIGAPYLGPELAINNNFC